MFVRGDGGDDLCVCLCIVCVCVCVFVSVSVLMTHTVGERKSVYRVVRVR